MNPHSPYRKDGADKIIPHKLPPELPVICILTHLPDKGLYHKSRWEIVKASLTMARKNAGTNHYLVVWDNGSEPEFLEWLKNFAPDLLILSNNVGVVNAMRRVFAMFFDSIVTWCNDDMIYYPQWLQPQIDILRHFPNTATVTGCVTRFYTNKSDSKTIDWARDNATLDWLDTPSEWDHQHGESIAQGNMANTFSGTKIRQIEYDGMKALIGGNHCQMTCYPKKLLPFLPPTDLYMQPLFQTLDMGLNEAGHLRLMTNERLTRHIGNAMSERDKAEIKSLLGSE